MKDEIGHDESGPVEVENFDYDRVDQVVFGFEQPADLSKLSREDMERGIACFRALMQWIWQSGSKNPDGLKIRAIICCWIFLSELQSLTESQMARGFGLKKQSLGRWVEHFKRAFPSIKTPHMRGSRP